MLPIDTDIAYLLAVATRPAVLGNPNDERLRRAQAKLLRMAGDDDPSAALKGADDISEDTR